MRGALSPLVFVAGACVAGCAAPDGVAFRDGVRDRGDPAIAAVASEVAFFPSPVERDCGPSAIATVLAAAGMPSSLEALREEVFDPVRGGAPASALVRCARARNLFALSRERWYLDDLEAWIRAGVTPIVALSTEPFSPGSHFVVLKGYDEVGRTLLVQDQARRDAIVGMDEFFPRWCRAGGWALVVCSAAIELPPGECRLTAPELGALGWLAEKNRELGAARRHYRAALERDPGYAAAAHNLANVERALASKPVER